MSTALGTAGWVAPDPELNRAFRRALCQEEAGLLQLWFRGEALDRYRADDADPRRPHRWR